MKINKNNNQISFNKPSVDKATFEKEISIINEKIEGLDELNDTVSKILDIVDAPPSYLKPSFNLSLSTNIIEHNVSTNIVVSPNFVQNDGGSMISYELRKGSTVLYSGTSVPPYVDNVTIPHNSTITYDATISYTDGKIKNTALGVPYPDTSIKAGNLSTSITIKAYAPTYYGVIENNSITESEISNLTKVLKTSRSNTITLSLVKQRVIFMYPRSFGNLTSIKDINNFDYINSYTLSIITYNDVEYNVYILTDPVTISSFRQVFS